ncbi:thiamine pyrophosphate-binding protein [Nocardioides sp. GY 10127]|uniref:thiamine pyrophosphate-binding protein n=1 Tax=Nocardioides sp. GY 10127 TaxID=2569762 RepID=UPI0010A764A5|nr:thiamine pyrophosphate-binding protein [Nocardioides sp. GY 10127]TIC85692.1 hypothetical protein E8D37_03540 [Nocardioides sp. GY 10127]
MSTPDLPPTRTVGVALVELLEQLGVEVVFGIPGSHNLPVFDGLARSSIRLVNPRHEQGAGFAADGYARATGRPGVLVTTTGPGILNAATALATAWADSVPVLAISTGARIADEGHEVGWLHESKDQHASLAGLVTSLRPRSEERLYGDVVETFARWQVARTRPVHLDVPIDLLAAPATAPLPALPVLSPGAAPAGLVAELAARLRSARSPMLVVGGGAVRARAQVNRLADLLGAPVATSRAAAGVLDQGADAVPTTVLPYAPERLADADLLLVLGSELSQRDVPPAVAASLPPVCRVDVEPGRLAHGRPGDLLVVADAAATLDALLAVLEADPPTPLADRWERQRGLADAVQANYDGPLRGLHDRLAAVLPDDVVLTGDSSQVSYLGTGVHYPFATPRSFLYPDGFAPLGYALPAAIGACLAAPERTTVALAGDGAFLFSLPELSVAVEERLPLLYVVVENGGYQEIEEEMVAASIEPVGVRFGYPDPVGLATAFGARGVRARTLDDLVALVASFAGDRAGAGVPGPVVIAVHEDAVGDVAGR